MKGDFSRFTFDPKKRFTGVRMQQGRVQLDADWNEQIDLQLNRERRELRDVIGYAGGPRDNLGFKISANGDKLKVGKGHYYVGGRLCWNEKDFEINNPDDLREEGTYLAYLDVWERHVTWLEDPDIREAALGGPDTATRTQLVSQVKLMPVDNGADCSAFSKENWVPDDQHMSTGKMRAQSKPVPNPPDDICAPTPQSGYTGLENQLYRVEIHEIAEEGKLVKFKWSRENGCIATRWTAKNGNKLTVMSTGLDEKLGFKPDDLVELTDKANEKACSPGILVKLASVQNNELKIDSSLIIDRLNPESGTVRRWEGKGEFLSGDTGDKWIDLEDGISIAFDGGTFQPGDYWTIPARAFLGKGQTEGQGDIVWPKDTQGNPSFENRHGPEHVYAPLAICQYDKGKWQAPVSCLREFPPLSEIETGGEGCCITVRPGEDIQEAIESLPKEGGCVCLKSGTYEINIPIIVFERSNLILRGENPGVRILRRTGPSVLEIRASTGIKVEGIRLEFAPGSDFAAGQNDFIPVVIFQNCQNSKLINSEVILSLVASDLLTYPVCAILIENGKKVRIAENTVSSFPNGVVVRRDLSEVSVEGNSFSAPEINGETKGLRVGNVGIWVITSTSHHQILHNLFEGYQQGIALWEAEGAIIAGNKIHRHNTMFIGKKDPTYAILVWKRATRCTIKENLISLSSHLQGGIRVAGAYAIIQNNTIHSELSIDEGNEGVPVGIFVAPASYDDFPDSPVIQTNSLTGLQVAIHAKETADVKILYNRIHLKETDGTNSKGIFCENLTRAVISGNSVQNADIGINLEENGSYNFLAGNRVMTGKIGIFAMEEAYLNISDSEAVDMKWAGLIGHLLLYTATISRCRFSRCGYEAPPEPHPKVGASIGLALCFAEVVIEHCQILDTGLPTPHDLPSTEETYGIFMWLVISCLLQGNLVGFTQTLFDDNHRKREDRALFLGGMTGENPDDAFGSALISNNKFLGPGYSGLVQFDRGNHFEKVNFSGNHCVHYNSDDGKGATINFRGDYIIVMGNHVKARKNYASMDFEKQKQVVLMGNVTTGDFLPAPFNNSKPQPLANYNLKI